MSSTKGGIVVSKQEMTKMWINDKFVPVTLVKLLPQEIIRYKTHEKDGYVAAVVGVEKKELNKEKGQKIAYSMVTAHQTGESLDGALFDGVATISVTAYSKGKGYQGMVKRCNIK